MGGTNGTRLDGSSFVEWGDLPHTIGTDPAGNRLISQTISSAYDASNITTISTRSPSGALLGSSTASSFSEEDGAGNTVGTRTVYSTYGSAAGGSDSQVVVHQNLDGSIAQRVTTQSDGTTIRERSGVTVTVSDNLGNTTYGQAFLDVLPVNDKPSIYSVSYDTAPDGLLAFLTEGYPTFYPYDDPSRQSGQVHAFDADSQGALTFSVQNPERGSATINSSTGAWQYQGAVGDYFTGADPFNVIVTDEQGAFAVVRIDVFHAPPSQLGYDSWRYGMWEVSP